MTTTTVRSAGGAPGGAQRLERGERVAQVGGDADVAEPERRDALDRVRVDVDRDHRSALHRIAGGGERQLAGVPGAEHADGARRAGARARVCEAAAQTS